MYYYRNDLTALKWFRKAAEQGHAYSQFMLGRMYDHGQGNLSTAVKWYRKAAEQGHADAQLILGNMCKNGRGVDENISTAVIWYSKAAMQGISDAQFMLGDMYTNGWGVIKNTSMAVFWYRKAAEQGHAYAKIKYEAKISVEKAENLATIVLISLGLYCVATGYCLQMCFLTFQICYSIFRSLGRILIITLVCFRNNWQLGACFCAKLVKYHEDWFQIKEECQNVVCQID